ncbi:MAG: hypothetical protein ABSD28_14325 [Tepidisphaeraceae bacterium]
MLKDNQNTALLADGAPVAPHRPARAREAGPELAREDLKRAEDRRRVMVNRNGGGRRSWMLLWLLIGPGILVMLGENDGPSMIS